MDDGLKKQKFQKMLILALFLAQNILVVKKLILRALCTGMTVHPQT